MGEEETDAFRIEGQRSDVVDVDDDQNGQKDELGPLSGVAEEDPDILQDELGTAASEAPKQQAHRPAESPARRVSLSPVLRAGEGRAVTQLMKHGSQNQDAEGAAPEQHEREEIQLAPKHTHDRVRRPFAGEPGRRRPAQQRHELAEVSEPLRLGQALGPQQANQQHHAARCRNRNHAENVPGAPGGEDADQQQRHRRSDRRHDEQER